MLPWNNILSFIFWLSFGMNEIPLWSTTHFSGALSHVHHIQELSKTIFNLWTSKYRHFASIWKWMTPYCPCSRCNHYDPALLRVFCICHTRQTFPWTIQRGKSFKLAKKVQQLVLQYLHKWLKDFFIQISMHFVSTEEQAPYSNGDCMGKWCCSITFLFQWDMFLKKMKFFYLTHPHTALWRKRINCYVKIDRIMPES